MTSLDGKKVVVFGGGSGIGLGVAIAAREKGASVFVIGRSAEKLRTAQAALGGPPGARWAAADMTREPDLARVFAEIGAFDHLVATAGTPPPGQPIDDIDLDVVREFVENKFVGAVAVAKHASRSIRRGGSITFTSGVNKDRPPIPGGAVVAAIAGSFSYFARALALEIAPTRVNVVSPGWVDTPMWDALVGPAKAGIQESMAARLPAGRIATPADVARAYVYLMESALTTGETIRVDGGQALI